MREILTLTFGGGHSLLSGHIPYDKLKDDQVEDFFSKGTPGVELEKFGLFDMSTPNYTTYYPDVTAEDLNPKDEDFIYPTYRLLSATTVNRRSSPVNFPEAVLKASLSLLLGQSVYPDHEQSTGNAIGAVAKVLWQDSYKLGNVTVPGGINGVLKIDGKSNPRIARGITMKPPSIHSNSVTVSFMWEPSHPNMSDGDFYSKLGEEVDGRLVERVATKIVAYHETSLVPHGADPFAQMTNEKGEIINPKYAKIISSLAADLKATPYILTDYKDIISLSETIPKLLINNKPKNIDTMNEAFITFVLSAIGSKVDPKSVTAENFSTVLKQPFEEVTAQLSKVTELTTELGTLKTQLATAETDRDAEIAKLTAEKLITKAYKDETLTEVTRLYKLANGDKAKDEIVASFATATPEVLKAHIAEYTELVDTHFPITCKSCGSKEVNRASAAASQEDENKTTDKSSSDLIEEFQSKTKGSGSKLHGQEVK